MNRTVKQHLSKLFVSTLHASVVTSSKESHTHYYKLPFVGPFSSICQNRIKRLTECFCKKLDIKLVFAPYKLKNLFSAKNVIPKLSRSHVIYKFACQAVTPAMSVRQTDLWVHMFVNIQHLIGTRTSFSTSMAQKLAKLYAQKIVSQSLTPPPCLSN